MPNKPHPKKSAHHQPRAVSNVVDLQAGEHRYVFVEGVGECRASFMQLVEDVDRGVAARVIVATASLLYVDTSPMWMEKFIASVKRRGVLIVDATTQQEYDLRKPGDEAAFRALKGGIS
ncbi:MAG TPA: hypothetical protein VH540_03490 [Ktedonobacterales bacterium]